FMPQPLSDDEVKALIDSAITESAAAGMQDMGKVMAVLKPHIQVRADMGNVSGLVRSKLAYSQPNYSKPCNPLESTACLYLTLSFGACKDLWQDTSPAVLLMTSLLDSILSTLLTHA
ncbi:GatB/YqeY domain-containing protein, partial [Escherichia coli]|uniref:GatB/YqeY domain-containing protein n=1 Tax=Escherichia coli TaxID=562 RepID=UPI0034D7B41E